MQKTSHNRNDKQHPDKRKSHFKRPLWWCGIWTMIFGSLCDFMALSFATQVLVASIAGSLSILFNVGFAMYVLKEKMSAKDIIGSLSILCGVVLAALANPKEYVTRDREETERERQKSERERERQTETERDRERVDGIIVMM